MKKVWASLLLAWLASNPAWADYQRGFYAGAGLAVISGDEETVFDDASIPQLELLGGYRYNAALGLELRAGFGVKDDSDTQSDYFLVAAESNEDLTQIDRELKSHRGIYYRPELINDKARLYALLGYAELDTRVTELTGAGADETLTRQSEKISGPSYGFGVGFFIDAHFSINFEARKLVHKDQYRFETISAYLDYRF